MSESKKYSPEELSVIAANSYWWKKTAELIGCSVSSFTGRSWANFRTPDGGCMGVPKYAADKIRKLKKNSDTSLESAKAGDGIGSPSREYEHQPEPCALREALQNIMNGIETGAITSDHDEVFADAMTKARKALAQQPDGWRTDMENAPSGHYKPIITSKGERKLFVPEWCFVMQDGVRYWTYRTEAGRWNGMTDKQYGQAWHSAPKPPAGEEG